MSFEERHLATRVMASNPADATISKVAVYSPTSGVRAIVNTVTIYNHNASLPTDIHLYFCASGATFGSGTHYDKATLTANGGQYLWQGVMGIDNSQTSSRIRQTQNWSGNIGATATLSGYATINIWGVEIG